jgi:hypothetical protein
MANNQNHVSFESGSVAANQNTLLPSQIFEMVSASFTLMEILRATLAEVERSSEVRKDDPAFQELKGSLVRAMAELSILRDPAMADGTQPLPDVRSAPLLD